MTSSATVPLFSGKSHSLNLEVRRIFEVMERGYILLGIVLSISLATPSGTTKLTPLSFFPHPLVVVQMGGDSCSKDLM
ncbi:hypothetical protein BDV32DRAFT_120545 [Aspergillus pseudonomiae]|nr:hypothetical protein BDV32DRAFT_120545 [Aspergillus pseudonomiae]